MMSWLIETKRLGLRPHALCDVDFMIELNLDPEVVRYTGDAAFANRQQAIEIVEVLLGQFADRQLGRLIAVEKSSARSIGWCGFRWHHEAGGVDLGFRFLRSEWGKGYATEAGAGCLAWLKSETEIDKIFARAIPANVGSVRVLTKLGFIGSADIDSDGFQHFELPTR